MTGDDFALTAGWGHFGSGEAVMPGQGRAIERAYTQAEREALDTPSPPEEEAWAEVDPTPSPLEGEGWGEGDQGVSPRDGARPIHGSTGSPRTGEESSGLRVKSGMTDDGEAPFSPSPLEGEGWGEGDSGTPAPESPTGFRVEPGMTEIGAALGDTTFDIYLNDRAYWRNVPAAVWRYKLGGYQVLKKWLSYRERTILDRPLRPEEVQHFTDTARRIGAILLLGE